MTHIHVLPPRSDTPPSIPLLSSVTTTPFSPRIDDQPIVVSRAYTILAFVVTVVSVARCEQNGKRGTRTRAKATETEIARAYAIVKEGKRGRTELRAIRCAMQVGDSISAG